MTRLLVVLVWEFPVADYMLVNFVAQVSGSRCESLLVSSGHSLHGLLQACKQYHTMLQEVYGKDLILNPHIMNVDALKDHSTCGMPSLPTMVSLTEQRFVDCPVALFQTCVCCLMCLYHVKPMLYDTYEPRFNPKCIEELPAWCKRLEDLVCVCVKTAGRQKGVHHEPCALTVLSYFCPFSL